MDRNETKNKVMEILSEIKESWVSEIHRKLQIDFKIPISQPALHDALDELKTEGKITIENRGHLKWIKIIS